MVLNTQYAGPSAQLNCASGKQSVALAQAHATGLRRFVPGGPAPAGSGASLWLGLPRAQVPVSFARSRSRITRVAGV